MHKNFFLTKLSWSLRPLLYLTVISSAALVGCNKGTPQQVLPANTTVAQNTNPEATPAVTQTATQPGAAPATNPGVAPTTLPAGTSGTAPLGASPTPTVRSISGGPATITDPNYSFGIKPTPTPTPAPTPKIEMVNGKIKQIWEAPAEYAAMTNPVKITPEVIKQGKELYMMRCEQCHGAQGKGNGGYNRPEWGISTNLASTMVQANTDGELYYKVTTNKGRHPASKIRFSDEERWMIVAFLRTLK